MNDELPYKEITFIVDKDPDSGLTARSLTASIFSQAESLEELKENLVEALETHFENDSPKQIRLRFDFREDLLIVL